MRKFICLFCICVLLSGCGLLTERKTYHNRSTSLVSFLYPDGAVPQQDVQRPVLNLPLRIGLAYTPVNSSNDAIAPDLKMRLLEDIRQRFQNKEYVQEIIMIPEIYLNRNRGYEALQQIQSLYQLDAIALISYDQIAKTDDNNLSLTYLTIVGSYIFHGTDYSVSTLIDLAVVDIKTRQILLRAAGGASSKDRTTVVKVRSKATNSMNQDFEKALVHLSDRFDQELIAFEERLRNPKPNDTITVKHRKGYSGSAGPLLLLALCLFWFRRQRHADDSHQ
ncbi:rhombotarget lipoprotein [Marinicella sp. W31]|uniref:rhombotarget lipoprotein n=1 Tax=Marinicella sp. W31 TaxID=3023713 RepID=UPI003757C670